MFCAGAALLCGLVLAGSGPRPGDPLADRACTGCHLPGPAGEPATARLLLATQEQLCAGCHHDAAVASHPSGFKPVVAVPAEFPVDWKGELTCSSCHRIHGEAHGALRSTRRGRDFCFACHDQAFFRRMADGGTSLVASAHLGGAGEFGGEGIDAYSIQCLECHGEQGDSAAPPVGMAGGRVSHQGSSLNHPVGVRYETAIRFGGYRPAVQLPPSIVLPDGKLSCISCHQAYSSAHGKMVTSQKGSQLCFHCHDL